MPVLIINEHPDIESTIEHACQQAGEYLLDSTGNIGSQYSILLTSDEVVRDLNRNYRHIDKPTNVLSFPFEMEEVQQLSLIDSSELGDIVISFDRAAAEARDYRCSLQQRLNWLIVHGFLHLLGFDHEKSEEDAEIMYRREQELLSGIPA